MDKLRALAAVAIMGLGLAGCTTTQQSATVGAAGGALVGGLATGSVVGAAVGAGVGAVAGAVVGQVAGDPERCYYKDSRGRTFIERCPVD